MRIMHSLDVYHLPGSMPEVIASRAPATECLHAFVVRVWPLDPDSCQMVLVLDPPCRVPNRLPQGLLMGGDLSLELHTQPLGCVHAWAVAHARHSRVSIRTVLSGQSPTVCVLLKVSRLELRGPIAVSRQSKIGHIHPAPTQSVRTDDPRSAICPCRRTIAPRCARRLCAPAASAPSPFLDYRKSTTSSARANMCASIGVTR